ncbi:UDP-3-O-(3-hydroxymyristoyl)glucosamine N-acyltransferase [bacterium]|nr:UDP-3-O-(3-hydroxymyristoyl)glucosamine N-acyltransferase [bacterium]
MVFTAAEISALLQGELVGDPNAKVHNIAPIESASKGDLSFISNPKYEKYLTETKASVVLVGKHLSSDKPGLTLIKLEDVYTAFSTLLKQLEQMQQPGKTGIEQPSYIAPTATIGQNVYIGAFAYIGENAVIGNNTQIFPHCYVGDNVQIGQHCTLHSGVKCYANTQIGQHVIIHSGAVIGSDGFGFAPQPDGSYVKMPQTGNVVIDNYVEIGANTTIDRATIKSTHIKSGVKLDNLIQIAHNVEIGEHTAVAAQAGISGSTKVGPNCLIGGQAGIVGHIEIARGSKIGAKAGIGKSIATEGKGWSGRPAIEHGQSLKIQAITKKLPELYKQVQELEKKLNKLSNKGESPNEQ